MVGQPSPATAAKAAWSAATPIDFVEVDDADTADIRIGGLNIDGPRRRVAHAHLELRARPGDADLITRSEIHFDTSERWAETFDRPGAFNIYYVALHEIGHALGLDDLAASTEAVMYPKYQRSLKALQNDDVAGVLGLSGPVQTFAADESALDETPLGMTAAGEE